MNNHKQGYTELNSKDFTKDKVALTVLFTVSLTILITMFLIKY